MIDPNIALSYRSPEIPDPLAVQARQANLQTIANQQQLQQAQLTGENQQNQLRGQAITDDQAFRKMYADSLTSGAQMSDDQILSTLGAARGAQFLTARNKATATKMKIQQTRGQLAVQEADYAGGMAYGLKQLADPKTGLIPGEALGAAIARAHQDGYEQEAQQLSQYAQQNPQGVSSLLDQLISKSPEQRKLAAGDERAQAADDRAKAAGQNADTATKRATDAENRAKDAEQRAAQGQWRPNGTSGGHPVYYNPVTGETRIDTKTTLDLSESGGGADGGRKLTPNASAAETRANQTDYEKNATAELQARQQRDGLDAAIAGGKAYMDKNGRLQPFLSMKDANGDPVSADTIAAYQTEMKQRRAVLQTAIEQAVSNKNNAMQRNGVTPQVSTAQAIAGYRGQQPATAAQPASGAALLAADPTGKSSFKQGQTVYDKQGNPVKIAGFTKDGKVIPAR